MNALTYDSREEDFDDYEDDGDEELPRRPRRQFFNRRSAALAALITCALGFYAGVRVEKGQVGGSTSAATGGFSPPTGAGSAATSSRGTASRTAAGGAASRTGAGAPAGGGPFGGGNASFGSVSSVDGKTFYINDVSGNTVKVTLSSATKISKTLPVSRASVRPGDNVVIQGLKNSAGTLIATSVTDSGASATSSTSSSGSSSSSSTTAGSAVNSLFAPGGTGG